jgi:formate dehydrogenase subunit delta
MRNSKEQLIHMVNQIAENNQHGGTEKAATVTSVHMQKFWARSMKEDIIDYAKTDGSDLSESAKAAVGML